MENNDFYLIGDYIQGRNYGDKIREEGVIDPKIIADLLKRMYPQYYPVSYAGHISPIYSTEFDNAESGYELLIKKR